ncbi:MAG: outer membrane lipid asymmetry maintenance protein MlaD [Comamonas sp.]
MQRSRHDIWVGLFVLLGAAAILFLALRAANLLTLNFDSTYTVSARFDNIGGLKPGAAVKSAGVTVGHVEGITLDRQSYRANVVLALGKGYQFPKDSSFKILTSGLLGEQYIGVEAGYEDENLAPGAVITQTQSAVVLENLIGQFLYNKAAEGGSSGSAPAAKP